MKPSTLTPPRWRQLQRKNFREIKTLLDYLEIPLAYRKNCMGSKFPLNVPLRLAQKMQKKSITDPLFLQFVPQALEKETNPRFKLDPVGDQSFRQSPRLLKKYRGRALLLTTSACAMHCRYCFRQNFDYETQLDFKEELQILAEDDTIHEVILSGGDPLSLSDEKLGTLIGKLEEIPHITKLRIHSRFVVGIPERIDESFLSLMRRTRFQTYFVFHINHPHEIDEDLLNAARALRQADVITLNQAVLLSKVNDDFETQLELHQNLIDGGILPYYLHQLDRVQGAQHFEVPKEKGLQIIEYLQARLPGYGVPTYVQEVPGALSKTPLL